MTVPKSTDFLDEFAAAMQADEDDEAVYGWMAETATRDGDEGGAALPAEQ